MPKRHRRSHRTMKGGFFDNFSNTLSGWGTSLSQGASNMWEKTKSATSSLTGSTPSSTYSSSYTNAPMSTSTYGGKRSRHRRMRGGYQDNTPTTGLAVHAGPISGISMANANKVGGRTKNRRRTGKKTRRHRKY